MIRLLPLLLLFVSLFAQGQQPDKKLVYQFDIRQEIGPPAWRNTQKALDEAEKMGADYVLIHMNTYGGLVDMADSIRTRLLNAKPTVLVFIDNNAASAGALIAIACDSIYMRKSASIGAATVVNQTGEVVPDKYQSYMRATMRATAESTGRDPKIAEAMVDPSVYIEGIIDSGKVLTFTSSEAQKHGFCNGEAENIAGVLQLAGVENYEIVKQELTATDKAINWLINPAISGILVLIIIGGIYFELQTPGVGFPLAASVLAAILYFAPLYLEGLAANWEILLFFVGAILLLVEIFVIPGFGVAGISGIALILFSLVSSLLQNDGFDFDVPQAEAGLTVVQALTTVLIPFAILITFLLFFGQNLLQMAAFKRLALQSTQDADAGYVVADQQHHLVGETGLAMTDLRPAGKVQIAGRPYDAKATTGWIDRGTTVRIVAQERFELVVEPVETKMNT